MQTNKIKKAGPQQKNNGNLEFSIVGLLESGQSPSKKAKSEFLHPEAVAKGTVVFLDDLPWMDGRRIRRRRPPCSNEAADPSMDGVGKGNGFLTALPTDITEEDNNDHRKRREGMRANASAAGIHVCQQCGKSYATSSNLSRHKQTHRFF